MEVILKTVKSMGLEISLAEIGNIFDTTDDISSNRTSDYLKTLPQAENLIKQLFNKGIKLALISNDISKRTSLAMEALGLNNFFQYIIGQDKVKEGKPSGELSDYIISKEQIPLDKIVNIGDHPNDILMGLNAGIKNNIGVLTGLSGAEDFQGQNCILINDLTEIEIID
jgi:HAD superfamily hydrolase (TIGR01549 family)